MTDAAPVTTRTRYPLPLILDAHPIPARPDKNEPAHWHYDMVYLFTLSQERDPVPDPSEISRYAWVRPEDVDETNAPVRLADHLKKWT
ncbi:MAG: hypothetical protein M3O22_07465 [Pseudomonadota bacterium]|nr:hypothetical protein [Pseudomonadota bacterium]